MKVVVVGGGPAGMMAAIKAAEKKNNVVLIEKNKTLGKKLLISGKGRCNITNAEEITEFIKNIPGNGKFLYSAFNNYTNADIVRFLESNGVKTKVERGKRVFPVSDKSIDVLDAFLKRLKELNVEIKTECEVVGIITKNEHVTGVNLAPLSRGLSPQVTGGSYTNSEYISADKIILATGGLSYPVTGSTGDGYKMASKLGHNVVKTKPSLVPLTVSEQSLWLCKELQGLSLKNVKVKIIDENKTIFEDFGEMLFTHFGVSGPVVLTASSILARYKDIDEKLKSNKIKMQIDLKPALDYEKLDSRILRDFEEVINKQFRNSLDKLLPQKLINSIIQLSGINPEKRINEISKEERIKLVHLLKCLEIYISRVQTNR